MSDEPTYKIDEVHTCPAVSPPAPEIAAAVYLIADIMAEAPKDGDGYRTMVPEALVVELTARGLDAATAREAVAWAGRRQCLQVTSGRDEWPQRVRGTITLHRIAAGEYVDWLGPRPADKPAATNNAKGQSEGQQRTGASVNARVMDLLTTRPKATGWSARQIAVALGCGKSAVADCDSYKKLAAAREIARLERAEKAQRANQR